MNRTAALFVAASALATWLAVTHDGPGYAAHAVIWGLLAINRMVNP